VGAVADVADAVGTVTADAAGVAVEEGARGAMYRIYRYQMSPTSRAATIRKQAPGVVAEDQGAVDAVARPWAVIATRSKSDLQPCRGISRREYFIIYWIYFKGDVLRCSHCGAYVEYARFYRTTDILEWEQLL
jgi:hypothetical protein